MKDNLTEILKTQTKFRQNAFFGITQTQLKVFNNPKNLFCYVAHYCNLVAEFNGLVSKKGSVINRPFLFQLLQQTFYCT